MTMRITTESTDPNPQPLDAMGALRRAWVWYLAFLFAPLVSLLLLFWVWTPEGQPQPVISDFHAKTGFVLTMFWIGITGALGFLGQEWYFRRYFHGEQVSPKSYLRGKLVAWTALMSGAGIAVLLAWLSQSISPHLFALIVVYGFMITQYPHGRAMLPNNGDKDRAQLYAEPK